MRILIIFTFFAFHTLASCQSSSDQKEDNDTDNTSTFKITNVDTSGEENNYQFSVGIKSPDTGCNQYANWWEVISEEGVLIYRRILGHSHVDEQLFVRSGGPVAIEKDQVVIIRAHMNTSGYSTQIFKGSIANGFSENTLAGDFAIELETTEPLPSNCAF